MDWRPLDFQTCDPSYFEEKKMSMKINLLKVIDVGPLDFQTSDPSNLPSLEEMRKGEVKMKFDLLILKVTDGRLLAP